MTIEQRPFLPIQSVCTAVTSFCGQAGRRQAGFSLIELMVTVAILAILAGIAAPSFTPIAERWRVRQLAEELQGSIYFARSEALKRSGNIRLEAVAGDWSQGWEVSTGNELLQESSGHDQISITHSNAAETLFFDRWGMISETNPGVPTSMDFHLETGSSGIAARLCLQAGGRSLVQRNGEDCPS